MAGNPFPVSLRARVQLGPLVRDLRVGGAGEARRMPLNGGE